MEQAAFFTLRQYFRWKRFLSFAPAMVVAFLLLHAHHALSQEAELDFLNTISGPDHDYSRDIAIDSSGYIYVTGGFRESVDFDPGEGTALLTSAGSGDIFIQKLDTEGELVWAKSIGGTEIDGGHGIAVDQLGNVYVTGIFRFRVDFDPGEDTFFLDTAGALYHTFVLKLDTNGEFVWAKSFAAHRDSAGHCIALDSSANVLVTGIFQGDVQFDPENSSDLRYSNGKEDAYVQKLNSDGEYQWTRTFGGAARDTGLQLALDSLGNIVMTGTFSRTVDFDPSDGAAALDAASDGAPFVLKLNPDGNFVWVRAAGGNALAIDASDNVYLGGIFTGTVDFDSGESVFNLEGTEPGRTSDPEEAGSLFVQKLDSSGDFVWAKATGYTYYPATERPGSSERHSRASAHAIGIDVVGNVYVTGKFSLDVDFDPGEGVFELYNTESNAFLQKLDSSGEFLWAKALARTTGRFGGTSSGDAIAVVGQDRVFLTGAFGGTVDFGPDGDTSYLGGVQTSATDSFILGLVPDGTPPAAIAVEPESTGPTNADALDFQVTFSEDVFNFDDINDLVIMNTGTMNTGVSVTGGPDTFTVTVEGISGDGSFTLAVDTESDVVDTSTSALSLESSVTSLPVVIDNTPPLVSLAMPEVTTVEAREVWSDPGALASDTLDGEFIAQQVSSTVDTTAEVGTETTITYTATDRAGNTGTVDRVVTLVDTTPPVITLALDLPEFNTVDCDGIGYADPGASAVDSVDGEVEVAVSGSVDSTVAGMYELTYTARDSSDNVASATRTVTVLGNCPVEEDIAELAEILVSNFARADVNGDGSLSFTEAQSVTPSLTRAQFDAADTNGDGLLSNEELFAQTGEDPPPGCLLTGKLSQGTIQDYLSDLFILGLAALTLAGWGTVLRRQ